MKKVVALLLICSIGALFAQYQLEWGAVTNGGCEFPEGRYGVNMRLADNIGNNGTASDVVLSDGATMNLYPGYRYVDLDLRAPISAIDSTDTVTASPFFVISWTGNDTTTEDGEGWGMRYYDVQYTRDTLAGWTDWLIGTTDRWALFGPTSPTTVSDNDIFFFRVKAYDLATNTENYPVRWEQRVAYRPASVGFTVNRYHATDVLPPIWHKDGIYDVGETVNMTADERMVVKNNPGSPQTRLALKVLPFATDSLTHEPYWAVEALPNTDVFAMRALFNDLTTPPAAFGANTAVLDSFIFTDAGTGYYGGPTQGLMLANDGSSLPEDIQENLWLQLRFPSRITQHGDTVVYQFVMQVKGRVVTD